MLNGLQMLVHLPALRTSEPAVALVFIKKLLLLATFDIIPYTISDLLGNGFPIGESEMEFDDVNDT